MAWFICQPRKKCATLRFELNTKGTTAELFVQPMFAIGGQTTTLADVVMAVNTLQLPVTKARGEFASALRAFRYRHGLVSADDCQRWLAKRRVTYEVLCASIRRQTSDHAATTEYEAIVDLLLADSWDQVLRSVAARVAANVSGSAHLGSECDWSIIDRRYAQKLAKNRTVETRARLLRQTRQSLRRLEIVQLEFDNADAANEAWCCVTVDGSDPELVAREARLPITMAVRWFDSLKDEERRALGALKPGQLSRPIDAGGRWLLLGLRRIIEAALGDVDVDRRLDGACDEETIEELLRDVVWSLS